MKAKVVMFVCAAFAVVGCGGDDGPTGTNGGNGGTNGGNGGVQFPTIDASTAALACIRGNAVPSQTVSGTVSDEDCHSSVPDEGYWETWRVRVASSASVTFAASSSFDNWLELYRVGDLNDVEGSIVLLDFDDDGGTGTNALLEHTLQPNTEYWVGVSGFEDSETGSYSLSMTVN